MGVCGVVFVVVIIGEMGLGVLNREWWVGVLGEELGRRVFFLNCFL